VIKVTNLAKAFPGSSRDSGVKAVDGVSFEVAAGGFFTLLGPSGCGKTTTLRCVAGLEQPDGGEVQLGDTVVVSDTGFVPPNRRDIGMVFQSYAVWPHLTVYDNAAFPLRVGKDRLSAPKVAERVRETLALVGLEGLEDRKSTQLSGGQQQRLSLARALVHQPACLLFDEPLSNLDAKLRERMRAEIIDIQQKLGFTALYVTHDQIEALSMSDEIAVMHRGRIVQQGTPREIYLEPRSRLVAEFIGASNIVTGTVVEGGEEDEFVCVDTLLGRLRCPSPSSTSYPPGTAVELALRPEDLRVALPGTVRGAAENALAGTVRRVTFGGAATELVVEVGPERTPVRVQRESRAPYRAGDEVVLVSRAEDCRLLPADCGDLVEPSASDARP
jgi:iron(III) transport system ATP-binding protein